MKQFGRLSLFVLFMTLLGGFGALRLGAQRIIPRTLHMQVIASGLKATITASPSPNLAGYNVWCGTTAGGPYTTPGLINPNLIPITAPIVYSWLTGTPGTTYFCVARAVDTFGTASGNSTEASGTFPKPAPPLPPAGLALQ